MKSHKKTITTKSVPDPVKMLNDAKSSARLAADAVNGAVAGAVVDPKEMLQMAEGAAQAAADRVQKTVDDSYAHYHRL